MTRRERATEAVATAAYRIAFTAEDEALAFEVVVDARLRRNVHWTLRGQTVRLRVPRGTSRPAVERLIPDIAGRIARQRKRARRQSDGDLMARAEGINVRYFDGELTWHTIRWVSNMRRRLGSCTTGGTTDGDIRISARIRGWPAYVIDYVIAHEICHRRYPDHSPAFWAYLSRYPHVERARGFLEGIAHADGADPEGLLD
jgi:predicted metal-dependent hydrolase